MLPTKTGLMATDYTAMVIADIMGKTPSTSMSMSMTSTSGPRILQSPIFPANLPFIGATFVDADEDLKNVALALYVDVIVRSFHMLLQYNNQQPIKGFAGEEFWQVANRIAGRDLHRPDWVTTGIIEPKTTADWDAVTELFTAIIPDHELSILEAIENSATLCRLTLILICSTDMWLNPTRADIAMGWMEQIASHCCFGEQRKGWNILIANIMRNRIAMATETTRVRYLTSGDCPYIWRSRTLSETDTVTRGRVLDTMTRVIGVFEGWEVAMRTQIIGRPFLRLEPLITTAIMGKAIQRPEPRDSDPPLGGASSTVVTANRGRSTKMCGRTNVYGIGGVEVMGNPKQAIDIASEDESDTANRSHGYRESGQMDVAAVASESNWNCQDDIPRPEPS